MQSLDHGFDYERYRKLLAQAVDEPKRLALIRLLIQERAKDRLAAARAAEQNAMAGAATRYSPRL